MPDKVKVVEVPAMGIRVEVYSYRELSDEEAQRVAAYTIANRKGRKKLKPGTVLQAITTIGFND